MRSANRLVQFCFFLEESATYRRFKDFFYDLLEDPTSRRKRFFDLFMMVLVLSSVGMLVYGVEHPLPEAALWFEDVAVSIFLAEYLLRAWAYNDSHRIIIEHYERAEFLDAPFRAGPALREVALKKWAYASSPLAIIDLLAILPSYRPVRLLRVFLLFRLFKLFRYARSVQGMSRVLAEKRFEFYTLALFIGFAILVASSAIYLFEGDLPNSEVDTFFDAVYWAFVTLSTVGYGDITPHTPEGRVVTLVLILTGIGVFAFSTSIVVSAFQEKLPELREQRVLARLERRKGYTVVCGFGRVGQVVVERLEHVREPFVIIEQDIERVHMAARQGYLVIHGDAARNDLLEQVGIGDRAATVLCITGDDVTNVFVTVSARGMNAKLRIISRANTKEVIHKLTLAGADQVVAPFEVVGLMGAEYVGRPVAFEAIYGILRGEKDVVAETLAIPADSYACGLTIEQMGLRGHRLILFGVISTRGGDSSVYQEVSKRADQPIDRSIVHIAQRHFHFNPGSGFVLQAHDVLVVFGHEFSVLHFRQRLSGQPPGAKKRASRD